MGLTPASKVGNLLAHNLAVFSKYCSSQQQPFSDISIHQFKNPYSLNYSTNEYSFGNLTFLLNNLSVCYLNDQVICSDKNDV